ncbi:MAG TPA: hypothetical protein VF657_26115 [Actinoplanes sp.]
MASDIDTMLIEALDDRAGGDVDPARLMRAAVLRGRLIRRRRRRRMAVGAVTLAVVAVIGAATVTLPGLRQEARPVAAEPGIELTSRGPMLPAAGGQTGAAGRPEAIGTDPRVVHFSVDAFSGTATQVTWTAEEGLEKVEVRAPGFEAHVAVARTPDMLGPSLTFMPDGGLGSPVAVRVGDRDGTLRTAPNARADGLTMWSIRWQPTDGVWAQTDVWAKARADAERVSALVEFDAAQRCTLPFTLTAMPPGKAVRSCTVTLSSVGAPRFVRGALEVSHDGRMVEVRGSAAPGTEPFAGGLSAGPYRVRQDDVRYTMVVPPYLVEATLLTRQRMPQEQVLQVLAGLQTRGEPGDPQSW